MSEKIGGPADPLRPDGRQSDMATDIARGAGRLLKAHGFAVLSELTLANFRRADLTCLNDKGDIWIVEIKSSRADFQVDQKWPEYRDYCDRLFFAVAPDFPIELLPEDAGLIVADRYGADIRREAPEHRLPAARRKAITLRYARAAAQRLHMIFDPDAALERRPM